MSDTYEESQSLEQSVDTRMHFTFLNRRSFLKLATTVAAGISAANILLPSQAFGVTSAEKQAEVDEIMRKLDEWLIQLEQYSNDLYEAIEVHDIAVENMNAAQARIDEAVARENEFKGQLQNRARTMYKQGPLSFLDVIFGSHTFIEFTTSWDLLNSINNRDADLIRETQDARAVAEIARAEFAEQEQIALQKIAEADEILRIGKEIEEAYLAEKARLEAEYWEILQEEIRIEEERRRREEEEERRRQELIAQQQAAANSGGGSGGGGGNPGGYIPYDGTKYGSVVDAALSRLGCPYVWAASGPNAFDCSGLTSWCYIQIGIYIPRGGNAQYLSAPMRHAVSDALPGDILYKPGHVGLYIGNGQFIHAPQPGDVVRIANVAGYGWVGASRW